MTDGEKPAEGVAVRREEKIDTALLKRLLFIALVVASGLLGAYVAMAWNGVKDF